MKMKNNRFYLGIFFGKYDDPKDEPWILYEANTQEELDNFTRKYNSDEEIRKEYDQIIGECALVDIKKIKQNETKHHNFRGRISAFYYNNKGERVFVDVAYKKRLVVRDYRELKTVNDQFAFFNIVFDEVLKKIGQQEKKKNLSAHDKMSVVIKTYEKYGYFISENEKYYLAKYFYEPSDKNRKELFGFLIINLKNRMERIKEEEARKKEEDLELSKEAEENKSKPKYIVYDTDDVFFNETFKKAIKENDFDTLFKYFTIDEITVKSNYFDVQREMEGKKLCIK